MLMLMFARDISTPNEFKTDVGIFNPDCKEKVDINA